MYGESENNTAAPFVPHADSIPFGAEEKMRLWSLAARYADGLPALSSSIFELNHVLSRGVTDLNGVVRVLSCDPSMAAQVLRAANGEIDAGEEGPYRLDECAVLVGASRLRSLVLTTPLAPTECASLTTYQALCQHCELTSRLSRRIAEACGYPDPYKAHIAGLLHDLGELPVHLEQQHHGEHGRASRDHCIVGSWLARLWRLPGFLIDAIEHHHDPADARLDPLLVLVTAAANEVSRAYGVGWRINPGAHVGSDCNAVLDRHMTCLGQERRRMLASTLQSEFLDWVKTPQAFESAKSSSEGNR